MPQDKNQLLRHIFIDRRIREGMRAGRLVNCATLARDYEVSSKTILRDIDFLKNQRDAPIDYDGARHGYLYTEESYALPAITLNESDLFAICIAEKALAHYENTPIHRQLAQVFRKIESSLPDKVSVQPAWVDTRLSVTQEPETSIVPAIWDTVAAALAKNRGLIILYQKPGADKAVVRNVDSFHVVRHRGEWYLLAYCHLREAQRTFALSRIRRAEMQSRTFAIPKNFDAEKLLENRFGIFGGDQEFRVRLRFDKPTAPYAAERQWHVRQVLTAMADGGAELSFPATNLREVMRWVLSWGAGARVLAPLELREMVRQELAWAALAYGAAGSS